MAIYDSSFHQVSSDWFNPIYVIKNINQSPSQIWGNKTDYLNKTVSIFPAIYSEVPFIEPGCNFPQNFSGTYYMGGDYDNDITINNTHIYKYVYLTQYQSQYQRIAVLFKGFSSGDPKVLTLAYKVYVRPVLEYCSEVWSPFLLKHINAIENVQRHFTRRLANFKMYDYNTRLFILDLESLEERRIKKDLKMYYKIMNGLVSLDKQVFFKFSNNLFTRGHNCRLILPVGSCRYLNSFSNRVIKIWNLLPYETVNATSLGSFSARLNNFNFGSHLVGRALV